MKRSNENQMMKAVEQVSLANLKIKIVKVPIIGTSPLIMHKFSSKAIKEIEAKKQGKAKNAKHAICNPEEEYKGALHLTKEGTPGFPAGGFKQCIVRGAKAVGLTMTEVKAGLFIEPDCITSNLVQIEGDPIMRTDYVRLNGTSADIRYRPEFTEWSAVLTISYNEGLISLEEVFQAIYAGGYGTGIGDWRPEKGGNFGRFSLRDMQHIQ